MWHDRPQQFAENFTRPLLLAEPRHDSGRAYWQSDVRWLVPFAIGQTCWVGRRNIRCPQCRQIQPSSSPGQDPGFDAYKDHEQKFLVVCATQEAVFFPLGILHRFILEWRWTDVASDAAIYIICYLERRIPNRSSHSRRSSNFRFSRLCWIGHNCCLPGGYGQTFVWARNGIKFNPEAQAFPIECTGPTAGAQEDDHSGRRKIASLPSVPSLTNHPPRGRGPGRITSIGGHRTRWEVEILNFLGRIRRSGESGSTQEFFVRAQLWTDNSWHNFQVSQFTGQLLAFLDICYSFGPWQSLCTTHAGTNLKAGQSCGPEKVCLQPSICSGVGRDAWRHFKLFRQPLDSVSGAFTLDLGSWKHPKQFMKPLDSLSSAFYFGSWTLQGFGLWTFVLFKSSVWIVWMLDIGPDRFLSG